MAQVQRLLLIAPTAMTRTPAFDRATALALALALRLSLHIVAFDHQQALAVPGLFASEQVGLARMRYLQSHQRWLAEQIDMTMTRHRIEMTSEVVWVRHPDREILQFIREMPIALIIKDADERSALRRVCLTPLDGQLLRDSPVPAHLVTDVVHARPRNVVAVVDVSARRDREISCNDRIVGAAAKLAAACHAQLALLHVYDWTAVFESEHSGAAGWGRDADAIKAAQHECFVTLAERHRVPVACRHFIEGAPSECVRSFAVTQRTDVIVLGAVQREGDKRLGSTAESILLRAPCSTLAIRPGGGLW